jgi:hypothetical protein
MIPNDVDHNAALELVERARSSGATGRPAPAAPPLASLSPFLRFTLYVFIALPPIAQPLARLVLGVEGWEPNALLSVLPAFGALFILRHAGLVRLRFIVALVMAPVVVVTMIYIAKRWL